MLDFLLASENIPFTTALTVMVMISVLEILGAMMGTGFSSVLDRLIPHFEFDYDLDSPYPSTLGPIGKVLSWLSFRRVPILVLLIIFLLVFGFTGLLIQDCVQSFFGFLLPGFVASVLAIVATFPLMRGITVILSKIIPQDETSAISRDSFIGKTAEITLGTARKGYPTQAKIKDRFGKIHYLMLEPDEPEEIFNKGNIVLLVKHDGVRFFAIKPENQELIRN